MKKIIIFALIILAQPINAMQQGTVTAQTQAISTRNIPNSNQPMQPIPSHQATSNTSQPCLFIPPPHFNLYINQQLTNQPEQINTIRNENENKPETEMNIEVETHAQADTDTEVTVDTDVEVEANADAQAKAQAQSEATAFAQARSYATALLETTHTLWDENKNSLYNFFTSNRYYFVAASLLSTYLYVCNLVIQGNLYLGKTDLWSSWRYELSFEQLCTIPQQQLAHALLLSIGQHYINPQNPTDFITPLTHFMHEIENERKQLLYWQKLHNHINTLHMQRIFPFNTKRYKNIEKRLQRLAFIKNIFITWAAELNIAQSNELPRAPRMPLNESTSR